MTWRSRLSSTLLALALAAGALLATASPAAAATQGPYYLWTWHSGQCVHVQGGSVAQSAQVEQYGCPFAQDTSFEWYFVDTDNGHYRIYNRRSGRCLNVQGGSIANSAKVIQFTCGSTSTNDQWKPVRVYDGEHDFYQLRNRKSGKCLNVQGGSQAIGADLIQFTCGGSVRNDWFSWTYWTNLPW